MRKVFLMAALVLASTSGSNVCAMNEAVQEASLSELMPVKKTSTSATFSQAYLCAHTWKYSKPGCAFTSENLLAKAGGEIAASKIEEDLSKYYSKFGFSKSNTYFTFKTDGTFAAKIDGKSWNGTYTFDEKTHAIHLKGLLLSASGFATRTANGISLLFEQKKLLTLVKTLSKLNLTGSTTMSAVSSIVDNYDGVRIGFEMTK